MKRKSSCVLLSGVAAACVLSCFNQVFAASTLQEAINEAALTNYTMTGDESYTTTSTSGSIGKLNKSFTIDGGGYTLYGANTGNSTNAYGLASGGGIC